MRVTGDVKIPFKIAADGITRIDDTPVHKALREVLANALIHADYHGRRGIVVEKYFRTITFSNPGTMRISKSVAVVGGTSDARNTAAGKISASVKTAKKTYSFSMASWAKFAEGDAFALEASAALKTGETLHVNAYVFEGTTMVLAKLSGGEFGGRGATALPEESDYDGCVTTLVKDVYAKSGSKWIDETAHALMVTCKGTYQFGFNANDML